MATMLDCKKIQPLLSEYIDGALDSEKAWSVKMHIASCAVCSTVADELRGTAALLQTLPPREPSANFEAMLAKRLADQVLTPHRPSFLERLRTWWDTPQVRPVATSAVALAAVVPMALFVVLRPHATGGQQPRSVIGTPGTETVADDEATVNQLWRDHISYASTEPLGNGGGMLLPAASFTASSSGGDTGL
jgi:anti-sigma factor RsiW